MEDFINETIDTTLLPRFEDVPFSKLEKSYWKVVLVNLLVTFFILAIALGFVLYNTVELTDYKLYFILGLATIFGIVVFFSRIAFTKKGFAFRNHDVLFKNGVIATSTIVIPYNRIQHVALHEGIVSRYFGLAKIQIFTAGGNSSDIEIPGIEKEQAENIKQLLMGKIQKEL